MNEKFVLETKIPTVLKSPIHRIVYIKGGTKFAG